MYIYIYLFIYLLIYLFIYLHDFLIEVRIGGAGGRSRLVHKSENGSGKVWGAIFFF